MNRNQCSSSPEYAVNNTVTIYHYIVIFRRQAVFCLCCEQSCWQLAARLTFPPIAVLSQNLGSRSGEKPEVQKDTLVANAVIALIVVTEWMLK